jgi:hypothetical protein
MNLGENRVTTVVSVTSISGPAGPVFDLITSARFWPEWHPATRSVSGVTQRPYQLGDVIHERVHFAGLEIVVTWRVAEHARPYRVVLQALTSPARITYSLEPKGDAMEFRRELEYDEGLLRQAVPGAGDWGRLMKEQSEEGVRRLKELVERILRDEQAAAPEVAQS